MKQLKGITNVNGKKYDTYFLDDCVFYIDRDILNGKCCAIPYSLNCSQVGDYIERNGIQYLQYIKE